MVFNKEIIAPHGGQSTIGPRTDDRESRGGAGEAELQDLVRTEFRNIGFDMRARGWLNHNIVITRPWEPMCSLTLSRR